MEVLVHVKSVAETWPVSQRRHEKRMPRRLVDGVVCILIAKLLLFGIDKGLLSLAYRLISLSSALEYYCVVFKM